MSVAANETELEYLDFHRLQQASALDKEFTLAHTTDWSHGPSAPYTVCLYTPSESFNNSQFGSESQSESYFTPRVVMEQMKPLSSQRRTSLLDNTPTKDEGELKYASNFKCDEDASPFSGLFQIPSCSYASSGGITVETVSQFCYQTHFEVGEQTIMFGGVYNDPLLAMKRLGIPRSTDPSHISVHLPCDLPPHINKSVFMSPLIALNLEFILFNPTRGTISSRPIETCVESYPGHLCLMKGTRVSECHVFFCGGFEVRTDSVQQNEETNRWIVNKSIVANDKGFILNTRTMRFTSIDLKSKLDNPFKGCVGNALVSDMFHQPVPGEIRVSLPPTGTVTAEAIPFGGVRLDNEAGTGTTQPLSISRTTTDLSFLQLISLGSMMSRSQLKSAGSEVTRTDSKLSKGDPKAVRIDPKFKAEGKSSDSQASSANPGSKMTSVFHKSTRMFHRSGSQRQPPLQNTYSSQVKQHRSQALQTLVNSRPTSPVKPKQPLRLDVDDLESDPSLGSATLGNIFAPQPRTSLPSTEVLEKTLSPDDNASMAGSVDSTSYRAFLLNNLAIESGVVSVTVYIFGGFVLEKTDDGRAHFNATSDLWKIELIVDNVQTCVFHPEAMVFTVNGPKTKNYDWPTPRGYFASILIDNDSQNEYCTYMYKDDTVEDAHSATYGDTLSTSEKSTTKSSAPSYSAAGLLERKNLLVQGGVDGDHNVFSDFYLFSFSTGKWLTFLTYAFDYFERPKQPYEDEECSALTLEAQVENPMVSESELRACHHHALLYKEDDREYIFFLGGLHNDYLRHFDKVPYTSDKLDILRITRFTMMAQNRNLLRVPALNLRTQMWKFSRFFYDLTDGISARAMDMLMGDETLKNCRISFHGGACSIVGKQMTICHGLVEFVPEKAKDFGKFKESLQTDAIFLGSHSHLTFPSM